MAHLDSDPPYVATSPNMDFVPAPAIGLIKVHLCEDFRYGVHDPIQWPQNFTPGFEYLAALRRREAAPARWKHMWWTPRQQSDFEALEGSTFKCLGLLSRNSIPPLSDLVESLDIQISEHLRRVGPVDELLRLNRDMRRALERLLYYPSTYRDVCIQVRQLQRSWLMARAYLDYSERLSDTPSSGQLEVERGYMGAFTTDPAHAQHLYDAGIPLWFIRPKDSLIPALFIRAVVLVRAPGEEIVQKNWNGDVSPVYSGLTHARHLAAVSRLTLSYIDVSQSPLLIRYDADAYRSANDTPGPSASTARKNTASSGVQRSSKKKAMNAPCKSTCIQM